MSRRTDTSGTAYTNVTFQVEDNGGTANGGVDLDPTPRTMTVNVTHTKAPVLDAIPNQTVYQQTSLTLTVHATDPDAGEVLTYSLGANSPVGAAIDPSTGIFTWTPTQGQAYGAYPITVIATDNGTPSLSDSKTFSVTVVSVPVASDDAYTTLENKSLSTTGPGVLTNDTDADGDALTALLVAGPTHGSLTLNKDGSFLYAPAAG